MAVDYKKLKANGFLPQVQKDVFSMRVRVLGGTVTTKQLATISAIADKYGHGYIHMTSRQGVEIPFIKLEDIDAIVKELNAGGVELAASGPRVRTITACQGGRCCPSGNIDSLAVAEELDKRYYGRNLPHKFKLGVTGCGNNCLKAEENDLGIKGGREVKWVEEKCVRCGLCQKNCRQGAIAIENNAVVIDSEKCQQCGKCFRVCPKQAIEGEKGYLVSFAGTYGNHIATGKRLLPLIKDDAALFRVCDAALAYFDENAQPGERLVKTLARLGWDEFTKRIQDAYQG